MKNSLSHRFPSPLFVHLQFQSETTFLLRNHRRTKSFACFFLQHDFCKTQMFKQSHSLVKPECGFSENFILYFNIFRSSWMVIFRQFLQLLAKAKPSHISFLPAPKPWWFCCSFVTPQHLPFAQKLVTTPNTSLQPVVLWPQQSIANVSHVKDQIVRAVPGSLYKRCCHVPCHCAHANLEFFTNESSQCMTSCSCGTFRKGNFFPLTISAIEAAWHRGASSSISHVADLPFKVEPLCRVSGSKMFHWGDVVCMWFRRHLSNNFICLGTVQIKSKYITSVWSHCLHHQACITQSLHGTTPQTQTTPVKLSIENSATKLEDKRHVQSRTCHQGSKLLLSSISVDGATRFCVSNEFQKCYEATV